jgi:hypothetical protein
VTKLDQAPHRRNLKHRKGSILCMLETRRVKGSRNQVLLLSCCPLGNRDLAFGSILNLVGSFWYPHRFELEEAGTAS